MQYNLPFANDNLTVNFIRNAFHALKQTFVPDNVKSAFKLLGLEFTITQTPYTLLFREDKLGRVRGARRFGKLTIPWTNSPKDVEKRDMDGSIKMSRANKSSFSVTLGTRSENICGWTFTTHIEF
jgi:hypothetical protein